MVVYSETGLLQTVQTSVYASVGALHESILNRVSEQTPVSTLLSLQILREVIVLLKPFLPTSLS